MFSGSSVSLNHFERVAARAQIRNEAGQNYGKMAGRNAATGRGALGKLIEGGTRQNTLSLHDAAILPPTASPRQMQLKSNEIEPPQSRGQVPGLILGPCSSCLRPAQATPRAQDVGARPAGEASLSRSGSGGPQRSEEESCTGAASRIIEYVFACMSSVSDRHCFGTDSRQRSCRAVPENLLVVPLATCDRHRAFG